MSNDNVDYQSKYLKYKKKYLDLKNELEGGKAMAKPMAADKVAAGKALYAAAYKQYAGMIKGAAGVCMATKDTLAKFHATKIKDTKAKELAAYTAAGGDASQTFGKLKEETKYSCALTDAASMAASSAAMTASGVAGKVAGTAAGATGAVLGNTGTVLKGALDVAANATSVAAAEAGNALGAIAR